MARSFCRDGGGRRSRQTLGVFSRTGGKTQEVKEKEG